MLRELTRRIWWAFTNDIGAVGTWKIYGKAKHRIGAGTINLSTGLFKMSLHRTSASTNIIVLSTRDKFSSVGSEISARGGYAAGGRTILRGAAQVYWTVGASAKQQKFTYSSIGLVFTASGSSLVNVRFALIHLSSGAATSGFVLCFASLSSAQFTITSPNTLTILPAATGVFTLA